MTYHRYLRFLPDGRALSLLDQTLEPREAVHLMTPDLQLKVISYYYFIIRI